MKKYINFLLLLLLISLQCSTVQNKQKIAKHQYIYPSFYKGIYINVSPKSKRFYKYVDRAVLNGMNTIVLDTWISKNMFSKKQLSYCYSKGLHVITRISMSNGGFKNVHVPNNKLYLIEKACQIGFKEIQLDYIRFSDKKLNITLQDKRDHKGLVVQRAKKICTKYNVRLSVDVFGRIPFVKNDGIGQSMKIMDQISDVICPMAYPSYYSKKERKNEYSLLKTVIKKSQSKTKNAKVVLWIQGFKHKNIKKHYGSFIYNQIKASENGNGFIIWNAGNNYSTVYAIMNKYFREVYVA